MNILNTELVWVEGHCYRKLPIKDEVVEPETKYSKTRTRVREEPQQIETNSDLPIKHEGDRFFITLAVPEALVGFVQGKKGTRRKEIEDRTSTQIRIPPSKNKDIDCAIVIVGRNKEDVASAYNSIDNICKDARWKVGEYTHFISVPMNDPSIIEGFNKFKIEVLTNCKDAQGISENIFETPAKLHVTIAMLTLLNNREKETASGVLQKYKNEILHILGGKSLCVEIKGVEYMNDDPSEVDVLYGIVKETDSDNCLQMIGDKLADAFANSDFSRRERKFTEEMPHVKLHVTLMKSRTSNGGRGTFDARKILKNYADFKFGQMTINEIHISVRFTGGRDSYYTSTFILKLSK